MKSHHLTTRVFSSLFATLLTTAVIADDSFDNIEIQTIKAADGIYMLTGKGGNIGLSVGTDGVFLIDDQFAPLTKKINTAIAPLSDKPVKFVLMNTAGNSNRDLVEPISFGQNCVIGILRLLLPAHVDNEMAADYLRTTVGQNDPMIEWTVVRPDGLLDETEVSDYEIYRSPTRSAIFNAGTTSRVNVANFMSKLINKTETWQLWKGQMPVIYNQGSS